MMMNRNKLGKCSNTNQSWLLNKCHCKKDGHCVARFHLAMMGFLTRLIGCRFTFMSYVQHIHTISIHLSISQFNLAKSGLTLFLSLCIHIHMYICIYTEHCLRNLMCAQRLRTLQNIHICAKTDNPIETMHIHNMQYINIIQHIYYNI